jgi:hypothetical protein
VVQGANGPASQTLSISNTGGGTLSWSISDNASWLSVSPPSGTGNGVVTVSASPTGLNAGSYTAVLTVSAAGSTNSVTVPVAFAVTAAPVPPAIGLSPSSLSFAAQQGGGNPAPQTVSINNKGGGTLTWSASDTAAWMTVSPASGSGNGSISIAVTTGSLTAGSYNSVVTVSAPGATAVNIPVAFTVSAAPVPPSIGLSPTSLSFTAQQGGTNPANQTLNVSNTGGGTLNWTAGDNASWLSVSPASGTANGAITVGAVTGSLAAGTYNGTVTVSATGATSVSIPVTFSVTAPPAVTLSPATLSFTATQGAANPSNQNVTVSSTGGTVNWTAGDNAAWLSVSPGSGTNSGTVTASVNTAGLTAGTYNGTITVTATGGTPKTVGVTLTVNPQTTSSATLTWNPVSTDANGNPDQTIAGYKVYRATASGAYGAPVATLQGNVTSYISTGLQVGTTYFFVVTAYDTAGNESLHSNEVSKSIF